MGSKIGKFNESVIKLWDYENASCLHTLTTPLESIRCVAFSPLSNLLAVVGLEKFDRKMFKKDECIRKQILVFYDLSKLGRAEPEICARQISDFDI
jgi:WD40 repeat protein